jgi:hypothetical protein
MADSPEDQRPAGLASSPRRTAAVVVVAIIVALGIAFAFATWNYRKDSKQSPQEFLRADKVGDPVRSIGPLKGADLKNYLKSRGKALADAKTPRVAVVSLDRYTTEREARASVGNSEILNLIAATPGGMPSVVERDLKTWADREREEAKVERDGFKSQIPTVDDAVTRKQFEDDVQRLTSLIDRVSPTGPVVFAVVIRAPAERLRELAKSPGMRLVDVGSSDKLGEKPTYHGIRPEETTDAGEPATRPL